MYVRIYNHVLRGKEGNTVVGAVAVTVVTVVAAVVMGRSEQAAEMRESENGTNGPGSDGGAPRLVTAPRHKDPNTFIGHGATTARLAGARIVLVTVTVLNTQCPRLEMRRKHS